MLLPQDAALNSLAVLETILSQIPMGLILFDRGFNNRKVFKILLAYGHHLLCRAKGNAVFYYLPKPKEHPKRGRKRKYGQRVYVPQMHFRNRQLKGQRVSVAEAQVLTKRCPEKVRLVVKRVRLKKGTPYRYFMVYTTDLELPIETILHYYRLRWELEIAFRDTKQNVGFDAYQVQSHKSISRLVQLSVVAASILQWLFVQLQSPPASIPVDEVLEVLGIHGYHPKKLTRGLMQASLCYLFFLKRFSATTARDPFSKKIGQRSDKPSSPG